MTSKNITFPTGFEIAAIQDGYSIQFYYLYKLSYFFDVT